MVKEAYPERKHGLGGDDHELLVHLEPLEAGPFDPLPLAVPGANTMFEI